jgi:hypothetical protein
MLRFLVKVQAKHANVPFHSWDSAVDSLQFLFYLLSLMRGSWEPWERLGMVIAILCRDLGGERPSSSAGEAMSLLYGDRPLR